jgi:hypothetical protein
MSGQNAPPIQAQKRDPAREAINNSREKGMHEVLARMLTTLHAEALANEQGWTSPFLHCLNLSGCSA